MKITRRDTREHLGQFKLACELARLIRHFFPDLVPLLRRLPDPRNQGYTTYPGVVLLMTRILSSLFYISSMRKTSEEFNSETVIRNIWGLCGEEPAVDELTYWETVNRYLKRLDPCHLQGVINSLCRRLLRSRAFEGMRVRGKYWQVIIDGTQLYSTRGELDGKCLYRTHRKGTEEECRENYYYVLEADGEGRGGVPEAAHMPVWGQPVRLRGGSSGAAGNGAGTISCATRKGASRTSQGSTGL